MIDPVIQEYNVSLKDILKQLKGLINRAEFVATKDELTRLDKIILRMSRLLTSPSSHYFGPEAKLYISSTFIGLADVVRIMDERGEHLSRSGCENRILLSARKFVTDFGPDTIQLLLSDVPVSKKSSRLDEIDLKLYSIENGIDYADNTIDILLKEHGIVSQSVSGYNVTTDISPERLDEFISLIKPYTKQGIEHTKKELEKYSDVLWHFRKANIDGSDDTFINYILRAIL